MKYRLLLAFLMLSLTCSLVAASFDCAKARTPLEKAICSDSSLGRADDELNAVWTSTLKTFPLPAFLRTSQQLWLKATSACAQKGQAESCRDAFLSRIEVLRNLVRAKVYTTHGKQFSLDDVTLAVFENNGASFIWLYGDWMPDAYNPQPPPNGWLLDEVSRLVKKSQGKFLIETRDYEVVMTEESITFGTDDHALFISPRQGQLSGAFQRVR